MLLPERPNRVQWLWYGNRWADNAQNRAQDQIHNSTWTLPTTGARFKVLHRYQPEFHIVQKGTSNHTERGTHTHTQIPLKSIYLWLISFFFIEQEIILGYNKTSYRMFLILPSLFFFTKSVAILMSIIELVLHCWAHSRNAKNTNPENYYRSPLHVLTSQFCQMCRNELDMDQVIQIQDKRSEIWKQHLKKMASTIY